MDTRKTEGQPPTSTEFLAEIWELGCVNIKTIVDMAREPVLMLDHNLCILATNEAFYRTFQVDLKETEGKLVYQLGNGQWDIPDLRHLLEDILPLKTFFKNFQVDHVFPIIGRKVLILNARQIYYQKESSKQLGPPIILLAMEDITGLMKVAESFARHTGHIEEKFTKQADKLKLKLNILQKELATLKR